MLNKIKEFFKGKVEQEEHVEDVVRDFKLELYELTNNKYDDKVQTSTLAKVKLNRNLRILREGKFDSAFVPSTEAVGVLVKYDLIDDDFIEFMEEHKDIDESYSEVKKVREYLNEVLKTNIKDDYSILYRLKRERIQTLSQTFEQDYKKMYNSFVKNGRLLVKGEKFLNREFGKYAGEYIRRNLHTRDELNNLFVRPNPENEKLIKAKVEFKGGFKEYREMFRGLATDVEYNKRLERMKRRVV